MRRSNLAPVVQYVRTLGNFYLAQEVAQVLDITPKRLRTLRQLNPKLGPTALTYFGSNEVWLYTADDVTRISEQMRDFPPRQFRPRQWTLAEYRDRQRRDRRLRYYRSRMLALAARGDAAGADMYRRKAEELARELADERASRPLKISSGGARGG